MIKRRIVRAALSAALAIALAASPALAASVSAKINASDARIYASSGESGTLPRGTSVRVAATKDGWAKIEYKGATGYIKSKYLTAEQGVTGYVKTRTHLYKSASAASEKLCALDVGTKLSVVGANGGFYQISAGGAYGYVKKDCLSREKVASDWKSQVQLTNWFDGGSGVLPRGEYGYIYDIESGVRLRIKRMGGSNHADVEPATKSDTRKLLKLAGGAFSWDSHAVILYANGKFVAAAINTMPHGDQTIRDNGYEGQFCLHMLDSRTHGSNSENESHQRAVRAAYNWAQR